MASYVVPRLLLLRLKNWGYYELTLTDRQELRAIDRLLQLPNLFGSDDNAGYPHWHWRDAMKVLTNTEPDGVETDTEFSSRGPIDHSQFEIRIGPENADAS
jgi:hypothetical protein